jgi:IclR helix-turn-helix domain
MPSPNVRRVSIELSREQVDHVLREASGTRHTSLLIGALPDVRDVLERTPSLRQDSRFSRSLLAGLTMLAAFPEDGSYVSNTYVARTLGMSMSTAHRYISTLLAVGLLQRHPSTRKYRLAHAP